MKTKYNNEDNDEPGSIIIDLTSNLNIEDYYISFESIFIKFIFYIFKIDEWNNFQKAIGKLNLLYLALGCDSSKQFISLFHDYNYSYDFGCYNLEVFNYFCNHNCNA